MRALLVLIFAGVAGLMVFLAVRGECPGGVVVMSEAECLRSGQLSPAACATVFARAESVTRAASTVYPSEQRCLQDHDRCVRSARTMGFTPVPAGFCVVSNNGEIARQEPVYRRINAQPVGTSR